MRLLHNTRNGLRILAFIGAAVFATGFATTTAQANVWTFQDGFDTSLPGQSIYTWWVVGRAGGGVQVPRLPAKSGSRTMYMFADTGGWVSVRETVNLTPYFSGRILHTAAAVYARPIRGLNAKVSIEVIDPSNWSYIALKTITLKNNFTWQPVITDEFIPRRKDIIVRVSVGSDAGVVEVDLDDVTVQAQYY